MACTELTQVEMGNCNACKADPPVLSWVQEMLSEKEPEETLLCLTSGQCAPRARAPPFMGIRAFSGSSQDWCLVEQRPWAVLLVLGCALNSPSC